MKYEVEVKYPLNNESLLREQLARMQATPGQVMPQIDHYLGHPSRDFSKTDEAFRLRQIGQENRLTYKGPLLDRETKSREEIELPICSGQTAAEQMLQMFEKLGFTTVFQVAKTREPFLLKYDGQEFEIVIDQVQQLGLFVELECAAEQETFAVAKLRILKLAECLQLGPHVERRSYLRLLLDQQNSR